MHTIITENDESPWEDETGVLYHFPKRYKQHLQEGTKVIYYKGRITNKIFSDKRLANEPHYFAKAIIGKIYPDKKSNKGDLFATIIDYIPFTEALPAKIRSEYLETIPSSQKSNYWRNGVRAISQSVYDNIVNQASLLRVNEPLPIYSSETTLNDEQNTLESAIEGKTRVRYVTTYERDPKYRKQAIAIHGDSCIACGFNFGQFYGEYAEGYIHIHHVVPLSEFEKPKAIDPETDLVPLCANCHSVVHRKKSKTLSIYQIRSLVEGSQIQKNDTKRQNSDF